MFKVTFQLILLIFIFFSGNLSAQKQMQSGKFSANAEVQAYSLHKGNGDRGITIEVNYEKPFDKKPKVFISVVSIDADGNFNVRYNVDQASVSRDGFTLKINTWGDSKVYGITGYWLAFTED